MNDRQTQQRLEESLREQAERYDATSGPQIGIDRVVGEARRIRRRRTTAVVVAAVAVVAVVIPAGVVIGNQLGGPDRVAPADPTPSTGPSPSTTPDSKPTSLALSAISRGPDPQVDYAVGRTVHNGDGSTSTLPTVSGYVSDFTLYHGGWLVVSSGRLLQLDASGKVVRSGPGGSIALSLDGTQTAFQIGNRIHIGLASGMSDGESDDKVDAPGGALVGFLSDGSVVYNGRSGFTGTIGGGRPGKQLGVAHAWAVSPGNDLVAATSASSAIGVLSVRTGKFLWTEGDQRPVAFSPDGKYLARSITTNGGPFERIQILDARTGKTITSMGFLTNGLTAQGDVAWEDDDELLFPTFEQGKDGWAILRLASDGKVTRATDVVQAPGNRPPFVFAKRP